MRQLASERRAISSVITGAILLTATVVMGTGLVNWSNSNLATYQKSLSDTFATNTNKLNENLMIENVWFGKDQSNNKFLNVTITNTGTIGLNVTDMKLTSSTQVLDKSFTQGGILPSKLNSTQIGYSWQNKVPIQIVVTTARGTTFISQVMPP
jgi:archaellum component FlaF (FlaF/FlaG flagellin family)